MIALLITIVGIIAVWAAIFYVFRRIGRRHAPPTFLPKKPHGRGKL